MNVVMATQALKSSLQDAVQQHKKTGYPFRVEIACDPIDPLLWLAHQNCSNRFYWSDQESCFVMAGIGIAEKLYHHDDVHDRLRSCDKRVRYFGGMCFDSTHVGDEWSSFEPLVFVLPLIECVLRHDQFYLCVNVCDEKSYQDALLVLDRISFYALEFTALPKVLHQKHQPHKKQWETLVNEILRLEDRGDINKVVLSRRTDVVFESPLNAAALLKKLFELAPSSSRFYFQFDDQHAFFGASPERLYRRSGRNLTTYAIAGTRPRCHDDRDDAIQKDLLSSVKDQHEHGLVVDWINQHLSSLVVHSKHDQEPCLLTLNHSYHLMTRFEAELKEGVEDATLLKTLHPTPAVAGHPQKEALKLIKKLEPFSRGWFAGPVMCLGCDEADVVVAIRSAMVCDNIMYVYAGAGIVTGSNPSLEWDEVDNKIFNMRAVLEQL